ncbi:hypothetical protein AB0M12_31130 [Nocardia vinacea]|uniref:hypothetical protein n=1 Tax=Nocardia vinacea TaxID=96468 RepID=UPI0034320CEA
MYRGQFEGENIGEKLHSAPITSRPREKRLLYRVIDDGQFEQPQRQVSWVTISVVQFIQRTIQKCGKDSHWWPRTTEPGQYCAGLVEQFQRVGGHEVLADTVISAEDCVIGESFSVWLT